MGQLFLLFITLKYPVDMVLTNRLLGLLHIVKAKKCIMYVIDITHAY